MKAIQNISFLQNLQAECNKIQDNLSYIQALVAGDPSDIKQVRYDAVKHALVICVEPWVWEYHIMEILEKQYKETLIEHFGPIKKISIRFLFS